MATKTNTSHQLIIGGNTSSPLKVNRMGYGTMRLTGPEIWGEPLDRPQCIQILRKCLEKGINYIDTADFYGPYVTNKLIAEALYPYDSSLVIGTKIGALRGADKSWIPAAKPADLRKAVEDNLKHLKLEQLHLVHFRLAGHKGVPFEESMGAMFELQKEGKILHVSLSNVGVKELEWSLTQGKIATVQNLYSYTKRTSFTGPMGESKSGEVIPLCEANSIPFMPFFSLLTSLPSEEEKIDKVAKKHNATIAQVNLAWLLHKSPCMLPIPGTSSLAHFEENIAAANLHLDAEDLQLLD